MAITPKILWVVNCDRCEEQLSIHDSCDYSVFTDENDAVEAYESAGWIKEDWGLVCDHCQYERQAKREPDL